MSALTLHEQSTVKQHGMEQVIQKVYREGNLIGHLVTTCFPNNVNGNLTTVFIPDVLNIEAQVQNNY